MSNGFFGSHIRRAIARAPDAPTPGPDANANANTNAEANADAVVDAVLAAAAGGSGGGGGSDRSEVLSYQPRARALPPVEVLANSDRATSDGARPREAWYAPGAGHNDDRGQAVCRHHNYLDAAARDMRSRARAYFGTRAEAEVWFAQSRRAGDLEDEPCGCTLRLFICLLLEYEPGIVDIVKSFVVATCVNHVPFDELAASSFLTTVNFSMSVSRRAAKMLLGVVLGLPRVRLFYRTY